MQFSKINHRKMLLTGNSQHLNHFTQILCNKLYTAELEPTQEDKNGDGADGFLFEKKK